MNTISPLAVQGQGNDSVVTRWLYKIAASGGTWSGVATTILNMSGYDIKNVGNLSYNTGANIISYTPGGFSNAFLDINGTGGDSNVRLINGSGYITVRANGDLDISASTGSNIHMVSGVTRNLGSTPVSQPVVQYGTATGTGVSGTVAVTIPVAYTSSSSYVVQVTMRDSPTAQLYATPTAANAFTIGWSSAGSGTQHIMWTSFGL